MKNKSIYSFIGRNLHFIALVACLFVLFQNIYIVSYSYPKQSENINIEMKSARNNIPNLHFLITDGPQTDACSKKSNTKIDNYIYFEDKETTKLPLTLNDHDYKYLQLCTEDLLQQEYLFTFTLVSVQGDCDMYISTSYSQPSRTHWDWKSTEKSPNIDQIKIQSFANEFIHTDTPNTLFISIINNNNYNIYINNNNNNNNNIHGKDSSSSSSNSRMKSQCEFSITMTPYTEYEVIHIKAPMLRGGQVILPQDLNKLKQQQHYSHIKE